ncbi:MAG: SurA N-terminal domain-containing protein [Bacteroidales bacterium]|jgi:peptidyl-prolyl cis-trans isomerase D|nr:SurA N-terminal domain-containing protein [Bacteroidales bacterium]
MSAIQFLREKAGVFVAGIIGLSLFLFVISDFFGNGRGQRTQAKKYYELGRIAGEYVSYQDFEQRVQNLFEIYKLSGTTTIDEATAESIREQVWQQMVREKIQDNQYKKLGIDVSTEELDELVLGNNPHPIVQQLFTNRSTGAFNKSFLVNFLKQIDMDETAKKYWLFFEDEIVNDRMNSKYNSLVSKGLFATSKQAEFDMNLNSSTVDFSYIMKNYASLSDSSVSISKSDIESYYSKHKENFKRSALRDIEYVTFDIVPSEDDILEAEKWITKTKEEFAAAADPVQFINLSADSRYVGFFDPLSQVPENLREFVKKEDKTSVFGPYQEDGSFKIARLLEAADRPDSVHARHILLSPNQTRTLEQTRVAADSLINLIKSGTKFETLAMVSSDDQGSAQLGGDLGWFSEGQMLVPFNNACFSARKGDITTVETTYGIHIIEILDQSKNTRKYNLGIIDRKIIPGSITNQNIYSQASQFAGTNTTYEKFNSAIAAQNLNKRITNDVSPQQKTLPGLDNPRSLIISLFSTAEKGKIILDNSQQAVFEVGDKYVVGFCTRIQEEGIAPMEDVVNDIKFALFKDKKAEIISAEFIKNNQAGKTLDDIARSMVLNVQEATQVNFRSYTVPGAGSEPALIAAASSAKQGTVTGPIKGNNGVYMVYVNSLATTSAQDQNLLKERLMATFQTRGSYEAYEALRRDANIVDKRYKFY